MHLHDTKHTCEETSERRPSISPSEWKWIHNVLFSISSLVQFSFLRLWCSLLCVSPVVFLSLSLLFSFLAAHPIKRSGLWPHSSMPLNSFQSFSRRRFGKDNVVLIAALGFSLYIFSLSVVWVIFRRNILRLIKTHTCYVGISNRGNVGLTVSNGSIESSSVQGHPCKTVTEMHAHTHAHIMRGWGL